MLVGEAYLSASLEDYLETIYNLNRANESARVKDIAATLDVKMPSVTGAIRQLVAKGLVQHQPYECVELTEEGLKLARDIALRHSTVREFLTSVLGLNDADAESEACGIEHAIRPDTLDKLLKFIDFVRASGGDRSLHLEDFRHYLEHGSYDCRRGEQDDGPSAANPNCRRLGELSAGMSGRICAVRGRGPVRKRLMEMGVCAGAVVEVVRMAPLGDPVEVRLRGYLLSLRKSEAQQVEVEVVQP